MLALALAITATGSQNIGQSANGAWLTTLEKVTKAEHASLCVDIDDSYTPAPLVYDRPDGERGLDRVGVATDRTWTQIEGVYVFRRQYDENDLRLQSPDRTALDFLLTMGVTDLQRLRQGDFAFSTVPADTQRKLRWAIAMSGKGVGDSLLAQYPDSFGMRLVLDAVARAQSHTTDGEVELSLQPGRAQVPTPKNQGTVEVQPLGGPTDGSLDFGDGKILTLDEIVAQADEEFGQKIQYDARMGSSRYFISGKFTQPRLLAVISAVTEPLSVRAGAVKVQPDPKRMKDDRDRLIGFVYGPYRADRIGVANITVGDLIDGKDTTFGDLFGKKPPQAVSAFMYQYRIDPGDKVHIQGDLYLAFAADGMAFIDTGQRNLNGDLIQYNAPLYVKFKF